LTINSPLISVVIPNFNCGAYLQECLESVTSQSYANIEIIVVDDGSTDNSIDVLIDYANVIRLLKTPNRGASAARNLGIAESKGEFIAFLDSDDVWDPSKLEQQMRKMDSENCDLVYASSREYFGNYKFGEIYEAKFAGSTYRFFRRFPARAIIVQGCSGAVIRKSLLEFSGNFDESFTGAAEDWDFFRRYSRSAIVGFIPEVLVYYRRHGTGIMSRPIIDWYSGNTKAIIKMFVEDSNIGMRERWRIWMIFQFSAVKTFIKKREVKLALFALSSVFHLEIKSVN
jgi:glycosyltransferase involved in cell wall biosynthesis